ncbi:MAG: hypothetical protein QM689_01000 [Oscillospiraceae bacterium]
MSRKKNRTPVQAVTPAEDKPVHTDEVRIPRPDEIVPDNIPEARVIPPEDAPESGEEQALTALAEATAEAQHSFINIAAISIIGILIALTMLIMSQGGVTSAASNVLSAENFLSGRFTEVFSENYYAELPAQELARKIDARFLKLSGFGADRIPTGNKTVTPGIPSPLRPGTTVGTTAAPDSDETESDTGKTKKTTKHATETELASVTGGATNPWSTTTTISKETTSTAPFKLTTTKPSKTAKPSTTKKTKTDTETTPPEETTTPETTSSPDESPTDTEPDTATVAESDADSPAP